ncbi:MAG TPA: ABC transporter ATP-binding protein [Humisphaera sp.]
MSSERDDLAIRVRGLSKAYRIGRRGDAGAGGGRLVRALRAVTGRDHGQTFWALRDVSFDVPRGAVVGVIGRNGAGKSTLLKILSGIVAPSAGEALIYGRVGSLLEVGTGFHPELTGRENIFLNGTILGMRRAEIRRQFDAIVDFAGVDKFLDTPVKRYSSGMYVRLAFAVAAHLEPEVLIVDEVLAVGDAEFQRKCIGKMQDVARGGDRTILFVSHNLAAVHSLCTRALYLEAGEVRCDGDVERATRAYMLGGTQQATDVDLVGHADRIGTGEARCARVSLVDLQGGPLSAVRPKQPFVVRVEIDSNATVPRVLCSIDVETADFVRVTTLWSGFKHQTLAIRPGRTAVECVVEGLNVRPDRYRLNVGVGDDHRVIDLVRHAMQLDVVLGDATDVYGTERLPRPEHGPLLVDHSWRERQDVAAAHRPAGSPD